MNLKINNDKTYLFNLTDRDFAEIMWWLRSGQKHYSSQLNKCLEDDCPKTSIIKYYENKLNSLEDLYCRLLLQRDNHESK